MQSTEDAPLIQQQRFEEAAEDVGSELRRCLRLVIDEIPGRPVGATHLAKTLSINKVLASRALTAARNSNPMAVLHLSPGPDPLRRLLNAAQKAKVNPSAIQEAKAAVSQFETLIRQQAGDRSAFDAVVSAWLPEIRHKVELRRRQAAFRAMSELKGVMANWRHSAFLLHPSADGEHIDVVFLMGLLGVQRLYPGVVVKLTSRRGPWIGEKAARRPLTLDGFPVDETTPLLLSSFCDSPVAKVDVVRAGEALHYVLANKGFGPRSSADFLVGEVNPNGMSIHWPSNPSRSRFLTADVTAPVKALVFDVFLHDEVFAGSEPTLCVYDTAIEGFANANDPARDLDRMSTSESITALGHGISRVSTTSIPRYTELLRHACSKQGWDGENFRGYRCRMEYPIYGSQVTMVFMPPAQATTPQIEQA